MPSVCFYFQVHQPMRLRHYTVFDKDERYFDESKNAAICKKVAHKCYLPALPANRLLLKLINRHRGKFKVAYSVTGVLLEQLERYSPEVLSTFHALAETGCVEFLAETYYHSLSFLYSRRESQFSLLAQGIHRAGEKAGRGDRMSLRADADGVPQHRADLQPRRWGALTRSSPRAPIISWEAGARISCTAPRGAAIPSCS